VKIVMTLLEIVYYETPGSVNRWDSPLFTTVGPEYGIDPISVQTIQVTVLVILKDYDSCVPSICIKQAKGWYKCSYRFMYPNVFKKKQTFQCISYNSNTSNKHRI
jgi:tRNA uridine 5-carbamoylmethylation protein Kti12